MNALTNQRMDEGSPSPVAPVRIDDAVPTSPSARYIRWFVAGLALAAVVLTGVIAFFATSNSQVPTNSGPVPQAAGSATGVDAQVADRLAYLVEEEKLAHDLYVLGETLYGTRVFSNIARSETQHQTAIRELLTTYGLSDPSANEAPGVFTDPTLQQLYDSLATRMNVSSAEAIEVGIVIEQTDIADLGKALEANPPTDVATVLTQLESASQNHLQAFTRNSSRA